jgi:hypothetical protein
MTAKHSRDYKRPKTAARRFKKFPSMDVTHSKIVAAINRMLPGGNRRDVITLAASVKVFINKLASAAYNGRRKNRYR